MTHPRASTVEMLPYHLKAFRFADKPTSCKALVAADADLRPYCCSCNQISFCRPASILEHRCAAQLEHACLSNLEL